MADERPPVWALSSTGVPVLHAVRCAACGMLAFPAQAYGCLRCGAHGDLLVETDVPASGTLTAFAVVQTHASHPVPFALGDLQLEGGPVIRVPLAGGTPHSPGSRYTGRIVEGDVPSLQFVLERQS